MTRTGIVLAGTVAIVVPGGSSTAWASKIGVEDDGVLRLRAAPGEVNNIRMSTLGGPPLTWTVTDTAGVSARQGCEQVSATQVTCAEVNGRHIEVHAGNRDDTATAGNTNPDLVETVDIFGGAGDDQLRNSTVYAAYVDGGDGDDTISANTHGGSVEIEGGDGDDTITQAESASSVVIDGGRGNDRIDRSDENVAEEFFAWLLGGPGDDTILGSYREESIFGGAGNDVIDGRPSPGASSDKVDCGRGLDRYATHEGQFVRRNCETAFDPPF
jgi:Ca2+-binding RTX toxin-like protein